MTTAFKTGDRVKILIDTWYSPKGWTGIVSEKQFSRDEGLISVHYLSYYVDGELGPIFDFSPKYLEPIEEERRDANI